MLNIRLVVFAMVAGLLAACGGAQQASAPTSAPAAAVTVATAAPAPAAATAAPAPAAATAAPAPAAATAAPAAATSLRTFAIVPAQTEASYEVQEQFLQQNLPVKAIGRTNEVTGTFRFTQDGQPSGEVTKIVVDLRTLKSDSDRRDNAIRGRWLESDTYPLAEFVSTGVEGTPASYKDGDQVTFKLNGNMTIRNVTKPASFDITGTLKGDTVTGTATTNLLMKDFGFDPPVIAGVLTVKDGVTITVNFTAKEQ